MNPVPPVRNTVSIRPPRASGAFSVCSVSSVVNHLPEKAFTTEDTEHTARPLAATKIERRSMTVSGMIVAISRYWQHKILLKKQEFTALFHREKRGRNLSRALGIV